MRKLILLFAIVIAFAAHAYDFCTTYNSTLLYYAVNPDNKTVTVTFGSEPYAGTLINEYEETLIEIPQTVQGPSGTTYTVTAIGVEAFKEAQATRIIMPATVTDIMENAFMLSSITAVSLPTQLKRIGKGAFHSTMIHSIEFPEGLEEIGDESFRECIMMKAPTFPESLKTIGEQAFYGCDSIVSVVLPKSNMFIDVYAFQNCNNLKKVELPKKLKKLNSGIFAGCSQLSEVTFPEGLEEIGDDAFFGCPLQNFTLPASLKKIGNSNFNRLFLEEFVIPDNITEIGRGLFSGNSHIQKITFGNSLKSLPESVCYDCPSLIEVTLGAKITEVGKSCFKECTFLTDLKLATYLKEIGDYAFEGCSSLQMIELPSTLHKIGGYAFNECTALRELYIPYSVKQVGAFAFENMTGNIHMISANPPEITEAIHEYHLNPVNHGTAILYVPRGTKNIYEEDCYWNEFKEIIEDETQNPILCICGNANSDKGLMRLNGHELHSEIPVGIEYGESAIFTFEPQEGYTLRHLIINEEDVISDVKDNKYTIDAVTSDYIIQACFTVPSVAVNLRVADGGSIDVYTEKGESFACRILGDSQWKVNSVYLRSPDFEGDVTSDVRADGVYVSPTLFGDAWLSVSFVDINSSVNETIIDYIKVYAINSSTLIIDNAEGLNVAIFDSKGISIANVNSISNHEAISVEKSGIYIVKVGDRTFKVAL